MKKALIVKGGWEGHDPMLVGDHFKSILEKLGFECEVSTTLDVYNDIDKLMALDLIVPIWTGDKLDGEKFDNISKAVESGVGMAGCHGGMCDCFRENTNWEFLTGGTWVSHPGNDGTDYVVNIKKSSSDPLVEGMEDFPVNSEQYYMHVDPAVHVLATTRFPVAEGPYAANGAFDMPVIWTKRWGKGKIFYTTLGHNIRVAQMPETTEIMRRGFAWAAKSNNCLDAVELIYNNK